MTTHNRIIKIECELNLTSDNWTVRVTKEFAPEYGGGSQTFFESAPNMHRALDVAREMVTVSPGQRTDKQEIHANGD